MSGTEVAEILGASAALILAMVAYRKWRPERDGVTITNAGKVTEMSLSFADRVDQDNDDLRAEMAALRREFDQYRNDTQDALSTLNVELRAERAEKLAVKRENEQLRARVQALEAQVRELKASGGPHLPA